MKKGVGPLQRSYKLTVIEMAILDYTHKTVKAAVRRHKRKAPHIELWSTSNKGSWKIEGDRNREGPCHGARSLQLVLPLMITGTYYRGHHSPISATMPSTRQQICVSL